MSISDKLKNTLNKLSPHLGNLHFGTVLKDMADTVDASAAAVEGLTTYSEQPKRIGTWVDGSPVYRKAFDVLLKDMDAVDYEDILNNQVFSILTSPSSGGAYPISAFCAYYWDDKLAACPIANMYDNLTDFDIPSSITIPKDQSDCTDERYYGYIDFIKPGDDT